MSNYSSAVKLLKTTKYRTYQFFGYMSNPNTRPEDGLKIAAITCIQWLKKRFEGNILPQELKNITETDFKKLSIEDLPSFNITDDYIIDVVSDLSEGIWALRIIENDLGALSGTDPVPGRSIHSDIAFRIVDNRLQCGFRTTVFDTSNVPKAACVRFSLIKELDFNPEFGLKQITKIYDPDHMNLHDSDDLDKLYDLYRNKDNQLPFIIYTYDDFSESESKPLSIGTTDLKTVHEESLKKNVFSKTKAYSERYDGIARPYFLAKVLFDSFKERFHFDTFQAGDVLLMEPKRFGGRIESYPYDKKSDYRDKIGNYTREKDIDFNDILFVEEAKILTDRKDEDYVAGILNQLDQTTRSLEDIRNKISRIDRINEHSRSRNDNNDEELEKALSDLQKSENTNLTLDREIKRLSAELKRKNDYIAYIKRKEMRPKRHNEIVKWAEMFDHLLFDKQAIDCLNRNDAENVDLDVICDSLDYLDQVYAKYLFEGMDIDELNDQSANIYNRPYEVSPSGIPVSARGNCKIKYSFEDGVRKEYPLDKHLKAGNHGELIRIYFLVDRERKKIVIGSLPNHLVY